MKIYSLEDPEVAKLLKQGAVGVMPSDTVYGLMACLSNQAAVERILELKGRPNQPIGTIIAGSKDQLLEFASKEILSNAWQFWPGPVSVILPVGDTLWYAHKGLASLPFRIPANLALQNLAKITGPIATTSANHTGEPTVTTIKAAVELFGSEVDFYVDGGELTGKPSKIVKIHEDSSIEIIREG